MPSRLATISPNTSYCLLWKTPCSPKGTICSSSFGRLPTAELYRHTTSGPIVTQRWTFLWSKSVSECILLDLCVLHLSWQLNDTDMSCCMKHMYAARVNMFHPAFVPSFDVHNQNPNWKLLWCQWLMPLGTPLSCHYLQYPLSVGHLIHQCAKQAASLFFEPQGLVHTHGIHVNATESTYTSLLDLCSVILAQSIWGPTEVHWFDITASGHKGNGANRNVFHSSL